MQTITCLTKATKIEVALKILTTADNNFWGCEVCGRHLKPGEVFFYCPSPNMDGKDNPMMCLDCLSKVIKEAKKMWGGKVL